MTGFVLALAGLACGDGGPSIGAAAPVVCHLRGEWEGTCKGGAVPPAAVADLRGSVLRLNAPWGGSYPVAVEGPGRLTITDERGVRYPGIFRLESGRLLICCRTRPTRRPTTFLPGPDALLVELTPTAQRKP